MKPRKFNFTRCENCNIVTICKRHAPIAMSGIITQPSEDRSHVWLCKRHCFKEQRKIQLLINKQQQ